MAKTLLVIVVDEIPDRADMVREFLGKGERVADKPTATLANGVVKALDIAGFAAFFSNRTVALGRQNGCVRGPKIGGANGALTIACRERLPQPFCTAAVTRPNETTNNQTRFNIKSKPHPLLVLLFPDKRPQFVALNCQPPFFGGRTSAWRGCAAYLRFTYVCNQPAETLVIRTIPASETRSRSKRSTSSRVSWLIMRFVGASTNWRPHPRHANFGVPVWMCPFLTTRSD